MSGCVGGVCFQPVVAAWPPGSNRNQAGAATVAFALMPLWYLMAG